LGTTSKENYLPTLIGVHWLVLGKVRVDPKTKPSFHWFISLRTGTKLFFKKDQNKSQTEKYQFSLFLFRG